MFDFDDDLDNALDALEPAESAAAEPVESASPYAGKESDPQQVVDDAAWELFCDEHIVPVRQGHRLRFSCDICNIVVETHEQALEHMAKMHKEEAASAQGEDTFTFEKSKVETRAPENAAQTRREQVRSIQDREPIATSKVESSVEYCSHCGAEAEKLMLCAGCQRVLYCSAACQRAAWKAGHKKVCRKSANILQSRKSSLASTTTRASESEKSLPQAALPATGEDNEDWVPQQRAPPPPPILEEDEKGEIPRPEYKPDLDMAAREWAESRRERLMEELRDLQWCDLEDRKRRLRALQLELHPDKQPPEAGEERRTNAQKLFLMVQREWEAGGAAAAAAAVRQQREAEEDTELARAARATAAARTREERERATFGTAPGEPSEAGQTRADPKSYSKRAAPSDNFKAQWHRKYTEGVKESNSRRQREEAEDDFIFSNLEDAAKLFEIRQQDERRAWKELRKNQDLGVEIEIKIQDMYVVHQVTGYSNWTVYNLKEAVERPSGVTPHRQRLLLGNRDLQEAWQLHEFASGKILNLALVLVLEEFTDYKTVMRSVVHDWASLQYASGPLRGDRTIVRAAMRRCWKAINHASPTFLSDRGLFLLAVEQDPKALLINGTDKLRADAEVVVSAVGGNWQILKNVASEMYSQPSVILAGLSQDVRACSFAAEALLKDRDFIMSAVQINGMSLQYAAPFLKADLGIVLEAISRDSRAMAHASEELRTHPEIVARVSGKAAATRFLDKDERLKQETELFVEAWSVPGGELPWYEVLMRKQADERVSGKK